MARFEVFPIDGMMVVEVQADILDHLSTRVVIPLLEAGKAPPPVSRLHPRFTIESRDYVMATHLLTAVPAAQLLRCQHSLANRHDDITAALDMLFQGF